MACLQAARTLNLPDWYLGAGFLRNAIWDHLHAKKSMTPLNDVDVVYFDAGDTSLETEREIEARLRKLLPDVEWEVRNQARMHVRHGHQPYSSTTDGIAQWIEVPTCVGVRLEFDQNFTFTAPFGLGENWSLKVRVNPNNARPTIFQQRVEDKQWLTLWPELQILD
ncbi:nucleotidyltransferase family protein [Photobacterium alginatilyticum]|uniref:Nucleotidyltransferase family protein n=2 Tax=Photobacterium alginatilyticum TaxID=1775171 RepID=A0ABW9YFY2_9GAMM|nr:nucleotidyltransferase family protein [Photobacterium alginatilyticum]NBI52158.1 nucleotidyltransferase family protein [Photobacterium alginatilyticum]